MQDITPAATLRNISDPVSLACGHEPTWPTALSVRTDLEIELEAHVHLFELDGIWRGPARIEAIGPRCFAFRSDGVPALVIPVVEFGELIDAVAVSSRFRRWLLRHDCATMLGHDNLDRARLWGRKPTLVESPMDWLAQPDTTCILDVESDAAEALAGVPDVICAGPSLARRINAMFARPRQNPRLWIPDA